MKLNQRDINFLSELIAQKESLKKTDILEALEMNSEQFKYSLRKIREYVRGNNLGDITLMGDKIFVKNKETIKKDFEKFVSRATPDMYRYSNDTIRNFIILKFLISDVPVSIKYLSETLYSSRTTIINVLDEVNDFLKENDISFVRVDRKGYLITDYSYHRFYLFSTLLKQVVNVREIYMFYYNEQLYSKQAELVFFNVFDLDILYKKITLTMEYTRNNEHTKLDDNRFLMLLILNYKWEELRDEEELDNEKISKIENFIENVKSFGSSFEENEEISIKIVNFLNERISKFIDFKKDTSENFVLNLKLHIQRFVYRSVNNIFTEDIDYSAFILGHENLFSIISDAITSFSDSKFKNTSKTEIALITIHYIAEIEKQSQHLDRNVRVLLISDMDSITFDILKMDVQRFLISAKIDQQAVYEFKKESLDYYDLVITTVPLLGTLSDKILFTNYPLGENEMLKIKSKVNFIDAKAPKVGLDLLPDILESIYSFDLTSDYREALEVRLINILNEHGDSKLLNKKHKIWLDKKIRYEHHCEDLDWKSAVSISFFFAVEYQFLTELGLQNCIRRIANHKQKLNIYNEINLVHILDKNLVAGTTVEIHSFEKEIKFPGNYHTRVIIAVTSKDVSGFKVVEKVVSFLSSPRVQRNLVENKEIETLMHSLNHIMEEC